MGSHEVRVVHPLNLSKIAPILAIPMLLTMIVSCNSKKDRTEMKGLATTERDGLYSFEIPLPTDQEGDAVDAEAQVTQDEIEDVVDEGHAADAVDAAEDVVFDSDSDSSEPVRPDVDSQMSHEEIRIACRGMGIDVPVYPTLEHWQKMPRGYHSPMADSQNSVPSAHRRDIHSKREHPAFADTYLSLVLEIKKDEQYTEVTRNIAYGCYGSARVVIRNLAEGAVYRLKAELQTKGSYYKGTSQDFKKSTRRIELNLEEDQDRTDVVITLPGASDGADGDAGVTPPREDEVQPTLETALPTPGYVVLRPLRHGQKEFTIRFFGKFQGIDFKNDSFQVANTFEGLVQDQNVLKEQTEVRIRLLNQLEKGEYEFTLYRRTPHHFDIRSQDILHKGGRLIAVTYKVKVE